MKRLIKAEVPMCPNCGAEVRSLTNSCCGTCGNLYRDYDLGYYADELECDDYNGHTFKRETGSYNACARDSGIEVCRDGQLIFSSKGAGKDQSVDTVHNDKQEPVNVKEIRAALRDCLSALDDLMGDSDIEGDDSAEFRAMQRGWGALEGGE